MAVNVGWLSYYCGASDGGGVLVEVFYNPVNGNIRADQRIGLPSSGAAAYVQNSSASPVTVVFAGPPPDSLSLQRTLQPGVELTFTRGQINNLGINTRDDLTGFTLSSP